MEYIDYMDYIKIYVVGALWLLELDIESHRVSKEI